MTFRTNALKVQAFAGALFGVQVGTTTMAQVNADITSNGGLANTLNGYYASSFGNVANATVAASVAANLGLTGDALSAGSAYVEAQLNAAAPGARGAVISNILDLFAGLASDATFGAAATAWNAKVDAANAYTGAANVAIGSTVSQGTAFALTAGVDSPAGTAGNDTFTGTGTTFSAGDVINGGAGTDTLKIVDTVGVMNTTRVAATVTNVENMVVETAGRLGEVAANGTKQQNTYTMSTPTADLTGSTQVVFATVSGGTGDGVQQMTYSGRAASFTHDVSDAAATAANFIAAVNAAAGKTVAYIGALDTVATNVTATDTSIAVPTSGAPTIVVGQSISFTGSATGLYVTGVSTSGSNTVIAVNKAVGATLATTASNGLVIGGGAGGVTIRGENSGEAAKSISFGTSGGDVVSTTQSLIVTNVDGNVGDTVSFTYNGLPGSYQIGASATATGDNFVTAFNAVAGYTAAVNSSGSVAVTAQTAGTALPAITFSGATGNIPSGTTTTANGTAATDAKVYDVSAIALDTFTAQATDAINLKAKTTTTLDLNGTGSITINGGGGASKLIGAGAISVGATSTEANAFTTLSLKGTTAAVVDRSALTSSGAVAVGSSLTTVSFEGTGSQTASTLEGKGITTVSLNKTGANVTVTNATVGGHAATLNLSGVTAGTYANGTATAVTVNSNAGSLATTANVLTGITVGEAKSITVGGAKSVNLGSISAAKLETLTVNGAGGVVANVSSAGGSTTDGVVTTVDTTGSTAALSAANGTIVNDITIGTKTTFVGGDGADKVTVADGHTKSITLGGGNDTLAMPNGVTTVGATGSIEGGAGKDTLEFATFANAVSVSSNSNLSNKVTGFETLKVVGANSSANATLNIANLNNVSANAIGTVVLDAAIGAATAVSGLNAASTVRFANATAASHDVTLSLASASGTSDSITVSMGAGGSSTAAAGRLGSHTNGLVINNVETINIAANSGATAAAGSASTAAIAKVTADSATSVVVSGTAVELPALVLTKAATIDASALTGDRETVDPKGLTAGGNLAVGSTLIGSAHVDTITLGTVGSTYNTGAGKDTIVSATAGMAGDLLSSSVYNTIDGGDAVDTLSYTAASTTTVTLTDDHFKNIKNVEKIVIAPVSAGTAQAAIVSVTGTGFYDAAFKTAGSDVTITNGNEDVTFSASAFTGNQKLTVTTAAATTNLIDLATGTGNDTIALTASGATNSLKVSDSGGNNTVTVTANEITTGAITLSTGAGNDNVTVSATKLTNGTHSFNTGAGNDYFKLTVANTITATSGPTVTPAIGINGGAGKDVIEFSGIHSDDAVFFTVTVAAGQSTITDYDSIIGFNLGTQSGTTVESVLLDFTGTAAVAAATSGSLSVSGYTVQELTYAISGGVLSFSGTSAGGLSLATKIALVDSLVTTNLATAAFEHAGNTYVFNDNTTGNSLVELVGITGITSLITSGTTAAAINIA